MSENKPMLLPEKVEKDKINVEFIYKSFIDNIESVSLYFEKFGSLAIGEDETIIVEKEKFYKDFVSEITATIEKLKEEKEDGVIQDYDSEKVFRKYASKIEKRNKISPKNFEILSRSSFLMLNNYFEYLLTDLLTYYYNKFKNSLNEKEFKLSLKELNEYETIEEVNKFLILKEVEAILVEKTFDQLLTHFEEKLTISLERDLINWDKIVEFRERRHLIVHNSSIVNKKYLSRTKNPFNLKIGETVHIDNNYFINALKEFKLAGQLVLYNCWGNWDKENIDKALYEIMIQTFENLKVKNYEMVIKTCKYSEKIKARNENQENLMFRVNINKAIALKKLNNNAELTKTLKTIQVGTASPIFKIAFQILNDNHVGLVDNFKKAIILDEVNVDYYLEWPIFDFVRETEKLHLEILETFRIE
jgi:hypothetical protein